MPYLDKEKNKEYFRKYIAERRTKRKQYASKLLGTKCSCGKEASPGYRVFKKNVKWDFPVTKMLSSSEEIFYEAIKDCEILCKDCFYGQQWRPRRCGTQYKYVVDKCRCMQCIAANKNIIKKRMEREKTNKRIKDLMYGE